MERKRLFSPVRAQGSLEKAPMPPTPSAKSNKQGQAGPSSEIFDPSREHTRPKHHELSEPTLYTDNFFARIAKTISSTFPFEKFAEENDCDVEDVARAIRTTIIVPLSTPSIQKRLGRTTLTNVKATAATDSVKKENDNAENNNLQAKIHAESCRLEPSIKTSSILDSIDPVKVRIPTDSAKDDGKVGGGGLAIDEEAGCHTSSAPAQEDSRLTTGMTLKEGQSELTKQTEDDERKGGACSPSKKSQVLFKTPQIPAHVLKPPVSLESTKSKPAPESADDEELSANKLTIVSNIKQSPYCPRSAKRRKTMAPVERQLVTQNAYGNYVPVEREKTTIRLIYEK